MKLTAILGAGLLTFSGTLALSTNLFATTTNETSVVTPATKPSQAELRSAISRIENIENYPEYSLLSASDLAAKTSFYREYAYLFELVASAKHLDENYDASSAKDISEIIAAAKDAEIACGYLFGTTARKNATLNAPSNSTQSSSTPVASSPDQPQNPSAAPHIVVAVAPQSAADSNNNTPEATPAPQAPEIPNHGSATATDSNESVSVPATGEAEVKKDNKPFFVTLSAVALACLFISGMIILNRKKSYHPGRKF